MFGLNLTKWWSLPLTGDEDQGAWATRESNKHLFEQTGEHFHLPTMQPVLGTLSLQRIPEKLFLEQINIFLWAPFYQLYLFDLKL